MNLKRTWSRLGERSAELLKAARIDPLPIRHALRDLTFGKVGADIRAGANVAMLALPLGIAYSAVAGLPIECGIYGSAIGAAIGPLFSGSRFVVLGPSNATAVLLFGLFLGMGEGQPPPAAVLPLLVVLSGTFLILGSLMRVANLLQYVSRSVITGYIAAAAVYIVFNQLKNVLGVRFEMPAGATFFDVVRLTFWHVPEAGLSSLLVGCGTAAVYLLLRQRLPRLPVVGVTLAGVSVLCAVVDLLVRWRTGHAWLGVSVAAIEAVNVRDWAVHAPGPALGWISRFSGPAMVLAFLSVLEANSIGKSLAARSGERFDANQELFGMGVANIACALGGGMPASGSPNRSQLNFDSHAATPLSGVFCGLLCAAGAFAFGPLLHFVPLPALGALVIFTGVSLINPHDIRVVMTSTRSDALVFLSTCVSALLVRLDFAIILGALASIVLFLRKVSTPELVEYSFNEQGHLYELSQAEKRPNPKISIVHVEGELFFGAAELFRDQARRVCEDPNLRIVILRMRNAYRLDATSVLALEELIRHMRASGRELIVSGARKDVYRVVRNSGLLDLLGRENFFMGSPQNPNVATRNALKRAQEILGGVEPEIQILYDPAKGGPKGV